MGTADGPPVPAGFGRPYPALPGQDACHSWAGARRRDVQLQDAAVRPGRRFAAVVVAIGIVLCMAWTHTSRIPAGLALLNRHVIATATQSGPSGAGAGNERCGEPVPFRRAAGNHRQPPPQIFLTAYIRSDVAAVSSGIKIAGMRRFHPASDLACRSAGYWFLVSRQIVPRWFPGRHGRYSSRTLAFGKWAAEEPARPGRDGCPVKEAAERTQQFDVAIFGAPPAKVTHSSRADVSSPIGLGNYRPREGSSWPPALTCLMIRDDRQGAGRGLPERWCSAPGGSGGQIGSGDRASLPGRSTRYLMLWLVCPQCGATMKCLFYDEGDRPLCQNGGHGQMEIQQ